MECPRCSSINFIKNGLTYYLIQNHKCKDCGRQFIYDRVNNFVNQHTIELIKKALMERLALRAICRIFDVKLTWLLNFAISLYKSMPDDLFFDIERVKDVELFVLEADEAWSFVGEKVNKQWIWVALERETRQIIAFHIGDRSQDGAKELWDKIPTIIKDNCIFHTDEWEPYKCVIPKEVHKHQPIKQNTNHIERFFCTLRQRVSRLVRKTLSFSKKFENHVLSIKYFFCCYNLEIQNK